ncbi:hypothetical protein [Acidithiobacillus sp.]
MDLSNVQWRIPEPLLPGRRGERMGGAALDCCPTGTRRIGVIVVGGLISSQYLILYITVAFYRWMEALREWCTLGHHAHPIFPDTHQSRIKGTA